MLHTLQGRPLMPMEECILDKTLLILGAGPDQIPGILKAKEMGIYTIVLDANPNAVAKQYSDEFYTVSIKHIEQIEKFLQTKLTKKVDGVIAFGVDIASIIARTADILGVNYTIPLESAMLSENKFASKEFMNQCKIAIPAYKLLNSTKDINSFVNKYDFPIIVKPIDNSAARGISYLNNMSNIQTYYNHALEFSRQKKVQVEKYLDGSQISTESFVINGKVYNIGFADRNYEDMNRFLPNIIENGGDLPSEFMKEKHKQQLKQYLEIISKKLNIQNGVIKGDIVIHNDVVYIIEFALRLSGGNFSSIEIPESTGVDFLKIAIGLHLNIPIDEQELVIKENNHIALRYKFSEDTKKGIIKEIKSPKTDENIIFFALHVKLGEIISEKTTDHSKRLGFVIAKGDTREIAIQNAQKFLDEMEAICE